MYESVPGTAVNGFSFTEKGVQFVVEGTGNPQITVGLEADSEYKVLIDMTSVLSLISRKNSIPFLSYLHKQYPHYALLLLKSFLLIHPLNDFESYVLMDEHSSKRIDKEGNRREFKLWKL